MIKAEDIDILVTGFAIHFAVPTSFITEDETKEVFRGLRNSHPKMFEVSPYDNINKAGLIITPDARQITLANQLIIYQENKKHEKQFIKSVSKILYEFATETKKAPPADLKIIGKYIEAVIKLSKADKNLLEKRLFLLPNLKTSELRTLSIARDKFNVHIWVTSALGVDTCNIKLDINNYDQQSGLSNTFFTELFDYFDDYYPHAFVKDLNEALFK